MEKHIYKFASQVELKNYSYAMTPPRVIYIDSELHYDNADVAYSFMGYDFIDMGTDTVWSTCNIGASSPKECGYYFQWGDGRPHDLKEVLSGADQQEFTEKGSIYYEYHNERIDTTNPKDIAEEYFSSISYNYPAVRMPDQGDFDALASCCKFSHIYDDSSNEYLLIDSLKNPGNYLIFPWTGYIAEGEYMDQPGYGYTMVWGWTHYSDMATTGPVRQDRNEFTYMPIWVGLPVKPVIDKRYI